MKTNPEQKNLKSKTNRTLILASQSPRRKQLLENAGLIFTTLSVEVSEFLNKNLNLDDAIMAIARQKAEAILDLVKSLKSQDNLILSSDTVVVLKGEVLGKPRDKGQAFDFLRRLSGQVHEVKTSLCFIDTVTGASFTDIECSFVTFKNLSDQEIHTYIETGDPMDKAGAYGIQGMAKNFISKLDGEVENVMGLPVKRVLKILDEKNWIIAKKS